MRCTRCGHANPPERAECAKCGEPFPDLAITGVLSKTDLRPYPGAVRIRLDRGPR